MNMFALSKKKTKNKRKGFSLVELMAVVAIIAIIVGLSIVGINKYRRSLKLVEMDGLAKEIYIVAQNNLTQAYGQGYLGISMFGTPETEDKDCDIYYFIVPSSYSYKYADSADSALDLMLPKGAIESTILSQGNFILRYQKSTGTVLDVYYASAAGFSFAHTFSYDNDYEKLILDDNPDYRTDDSARKNYGGAVIGYCGNYEGSGKSVNSFGLESPVVKGVNKNMLYAIVTFPKVDTTKYDEHKTITVVGEDGQKAVFEIDNSKVTRKFYDKNGNYNEKTGLKSFVMTDDDAYLYQITKDTTMSGGVVVSKGSYVVILDDITTKDHNFADLYPSTEGWVPGDDIIVQAEIKVEDKDNTSVNYSGVSNKVVLNSLFESNFETKKEGNTVKEITVTNIRQLENLSKSISGFNPGTIPAVIDQTGDIDFNDFLEEFKDKQIYEGKNPAEKNSFVPIDITYKFEYNGNDNAIENLNVKTKGSAGLFGDVSSSGSEIKNLEIINPNIYSYDGNAGSLVATVTGGKNDYINISGVIAYNARPVNASASWTDENLKIHAAWSAGGLIGAGTNIKVEACAAAVYVEAAPKDNNLSNMGSSDDKRANAGGFIGRAATSEIIGCYSGGHTVSGKYLSSLSGNGRVNVIGTYFAGGFAGNCYSSTVQFCYSTCSVAAYSTMGGVTNSIKGVSGFSPKISHVSKIEYCYSVGRVVGSDKSYNFVSTNTVDSGEIQSGKLNYYLENVSVNQKNNSSALKVYGVQGFTIESNNRDVIAYTASRKTAYNYDSTVKVDFGGKYYFLTVDQLYERHGFAGTKKSGITDVQYGDWQITNVTDAATFFVNGDTLQLWVDLDAVKKSGDAELTVGIKGLTSGNARVMLFDLENASANKTVSYRPGYITNDGDIVWATDKKGITKIPAKIDESGSYLVITLDDITTKGAHFYELFGVAEGSFPVLTPGENISAYALSGTAKTGAQLYAADSATTNSLFDYGANRKSGIVKIDNVKTNVMYVSSIRHLQNIASIVSKLDTSRPGQAYICEDLTWNDSFNTIYHYSSEKSYSGFAGIIYSTGLLFDGQRHTLNNFKFAGIETNISDSEKAIISGLFRYIKCASQKVTIQNLIITNPTAAASSSKYSVYASALIGCVIKNDTKTVDLTISNVAVIDNSSDASSNPAISAKDSSSSRYAYAGGLIASIYPSSTSNITITNSSVSACVKSTGKSSRSYAGGLIGRIAQGQLTISKCYVGGHTTKGKYDSNSWNIDGGQAGGFIGSSNSKISTTIYIDSSFTTASVSGSYTAGSFVGTLYRPLDLNNVYTAAPVNNVKKSSKDSGALVGRVDQSNGVGSVNINNVYYFPECYDNAALTTSQLFKVGSSYVTGTAEAVYYDIETGAVSSENAQQNITIKKGNTVVITHPFDSILNYLDKEYPFISWTISPYSNESKMISFTGDWAIEGITEAEAHEVTFYYMNGGTSGLLTAPQNNTKKFIAKSDGTAEVIVPSMDSSNPGSYASVYYVGSKINGVVNASWYETATKFDIKSDEWANGTITIPSGYAAKDCSILVIYLHDKNVFSVDFRYDKTGKNNYAQSNAANIEQLGAAQIVTKLNQVVVPNCNINGLTLIGWYSDPECTKEIDFSNATTLTESVTAYAKFGQPYTVSITYLYMEGTATKEMFNAPATKSYLAGSGKQTVTLLEGSSDVFQKAFKLLYVAKDSINGTRVTTTASGNTNTFVLDSEKDASYVAVYEASTEAFSMEYKVQFVFKKTASDWSYNSTSTKILTYPESGTYHADNAADLLSMGKNGGTFTDFFSNQTIGSTNVKWSEGYVITGYTLPEATDSNPIVTVNIERRKYTLSADANTGAYIEPIEVEYGKTIYSVIGDAIPTRKGYSFPTNFNDRWDYYQLGSSSSTAKQLTSTTTMPAYNTVLAANWIAGTSTYNVLFWFENADDTNYSYGGSITQSGTTGTQVSTDSWNTLSSLSSGGTTHVHSPSCYAGATGTMFTTETESSGGCNDNKYWVVNGIRLSTDNDPSKVSNASSGLVRYFTNVNGETVKGIKVESDWYVYNGSEASGTVIPCTGSSINWLTEDYKNYFTYSQGKSYLKSSDKNGHETIYADGTTTLNVYYSRNAYNLYVELDNGNYYHTHVNSCYTLTCGILENHTHTTNCLSCTTTAHTHTSACIHHHTSACKINCTHSHNISCYFSSSSSYSTSSNSSDATKGLGYVKQAYPSPINGRYYKVKSSGCSDTYYYLYFNNTWYYVDSSSNPSNYNSGKEIKVSGVKITIYESQTTLTASYCQHTHDKNCYSCKLMDGDLGCGFNYEHVHSDKAGCYGKCTAQGSHIHSDACYSLTCKLEECTQSDGKNYAVILRAKYQQSINDEWNNYVVAKVSGAGRWRDDTYDWSDGKTKNYFDSDYYLSTIDIMPGQNVFLEYLDNSSTYATLYYYLQTPGNVATSTSIKVDNYYFDVYKTAKIRGGSSYSFTLEEEFSLIDGFSRYAFIVPDSDNGMEYNVKRITNYGVYGGRIVNLYYLRDSYTLELWVDGAKSKTYSVQSDVVLDSYCKGDATARPAGVPSDYVFSGWYFDKECTQQKYVSGTTMPKSNYILYAKWEPPIKTVTFKLTETGSEWNTAQTRKYSTLEGIITDKTTNEYLKEYKVDGLAYWYYKENGENKRFIPQKQIVEDMTVYAAYASKTETAKVTVKYKYGDKVDTAEYDYTVGGLFIASSKAISGFEITGWRHGESGALNEDSTASILVSSDAKNNVIVFEYQKEITWSYTVKYVALYKNQTTGTVNGVTLATSEYTKNISTNTVSSLNKTDSKIIEYKVPEGYGNYTLDHMSVDGKDVVGRTYEFMKYDGNTSREITFYVTPDKNKCTLSDLHYTYDSTDKLKNVSSSAFSQLPNYGDNVKLEIYCSTTYKEAVHAGSYKLDVCGVITVKDDSNSYSYLLWDEEDRNVNLVIDPLSIKLKSKSAFQVYTTKALTAPEVTLASDETKDWKTAFCGTDATWFEPVFTVDAFRQEAGTSQNSFTMQLKSGANEKLKDDYLIETEFGTLTVGWKYKVVYEFRYRSTVEGDTTEPLTWDIDKTAEAVQISKSTESVSVAMPDAYKNKNLRLCYSYAGNDVVLGTNASYTVDISPELNQNYSSYTSVLTVYVEPDVTLAEAYLPSISPSCTYDAKVHKLAAVSGFNANLFSSYKPSDVTSATLELSTVYRDADGNKVTSPTDAGIYSTSSALYLKVKIDGKSTKFKIAADTSKKVSLTINPIEIKLTSPKSSAYIDVDGKLVFAGDKVSIGDKDGKAVSEDIIKADNFTVEYADNGKLTIGSNTEGNYFTINWKSGVNSDNYDVTRVYGDLDLTWRMKLTYWLRPTNIDTTNVKNYAGVLFDRTGTAYMLTGTSPEYLENTEGKTTVKVNDFTAASGFTIASDYSYNDESYKFANESELAPYKNAYGVYGANELKVYLTPDTSNASVQAAIASAKAFSESGYNTNGETTLDWSSITLNDISSVSAYVYVPAVVYVDGGGNKVTSLVSGTQYTRYSYVILSVTTVSSSETTVNNYLLDYYQESFTAQ